MEVFDLWRCDVSTRKMVYRLHDQAEDEESKSLINTLRNMTIVLSRECYIPGVPKKVHKFKIICLCFENRQITKFCVFCWTRPQLKF